MSEGDQRFTEQWDALDPFDPSYPHLWVKVEHLGRYLFASNYLSTDGARRVIDVGCGTGYGSHELAATGLSVTAVDSNADLLAGLEASADDSITPVELNLAHKSIGESLHGRHFDSAVCFETLEHLTDPLRLLEHLHSCLKAHSVLILSVPNSVAENTNETGLVSNRLHRRMFSISSVSELLNRSGFAVREVLGQPLAAEISRREARLIRQKRMDGRLGDEPALHSREMIRRLALTVGFPEPRDVERSYSIVLVAERIG